MKQFSGTGNWHAAATARSHMGWSKDISKASFEGRENIKVKIGLTRTKKSPQQLHCNSGYSQRTLQTSTFPPAMSSPGNQSSESSRTGSCTHDFAASPFHPANPHSWPQSPKHKWFCPNSLIWATRLGPTAPFLLSPHSHRELPSPSHPQWKYSTSWSPRSHSSPSWSNPRKRFV